MEPLDQHDPRRLGSFEVLGRLGKGGMGLVYLGRSVAGRLVAIKTVRAELAEDKLFRTRFDREIKAARTVSGFYTAAVVAADAHATIPWLATAYVPAPSLEDLVVAAGPLPVSAVRWIAAGVAEALQSIHAADLVHRDLKPSNVLVLEDGPRVIDFGIAAGGQYTRVTMTNVAVGTPAYMSPEQARNSRGVTGASDIFSLGSTLVYAATGHAPYRGSGPVEIVSQLLNRQPDLDALPDDLRPLMQACLRHSIERRPTPADLQDELAPHLFSLDDAAGGAVTWLPPEALDVIIERSGRQIARSEESAAARVVSAHGQASAPASSPAQRSAPPPPPSQPPPQPSSAPAVADPSAQQPSAQAQQGGDRDKMRSALSRAREALPQQGGGVDHPPGPAADPRAASAAPDGSAHVASESPVSPEAGAFTPPPLPSQPPTGTPAPDVSVRSVRLPGSGAEVGPGLSAAEVEARAAGQADHPLSSVEWARHEAGVEPAPPVPAAAPRRLTDTAPAPPYQRPEGWRPWRFRMSNGVWGSPLTWGGDLYVSSFEVHALDLSTGRRRFKSGTPVWTMRIADDLVHAADGQSLYTFDTGTGEPRWQVTAGGWIYSLSVGRGAVCAGTRGGGVQAWGASDGTPWWRLGDAQASQEFPQTGPEILQDAVFYHVAGGGGLELHAIDLASGVPRWSAPVGGAAPLRPTVADPDTGAGGLVFVAAGASLYALDSAAGGLLWRFDAAAEIRTPPVVVSGPGPAAVCVADARGQVSMVGAGDGRARWQTETEGTPGTEPIVAGSGVVLVTSAATVHALDTADGHPRWRFDARAAVVGSPAYADGLAHIGSKDHRLYTVDTVSGRLRWRLETGGEITGTPAVAGGAVCVCSADTCVYALDAARGTATAR